VNEIFKTAAAVQKVCETAGWKFCLVGGLALQRWGEPRVTKDADLTVYTGFQNDAAVIAELLKHFPARISDPAEFALRNRVLLMQSTSGVGIDIALGGLPFEHEMVNRASPFIYPGNISLRTCSAEDLVVMKVFAGRPQDWVDVERVIIRQTGNLDWLYIERQLMPLLELKEDRAALPRLRKLQIECEQ
jgi:hypothetical protein